MSSSTAEEDFKNQIIQETAKDFQTHLLQTGKDGTLAMLQMVYQHTTVTEDQVSELESFIKKHKYDNQKNVINKLNNLINESSLKQLGNNIAVRDLFQSQEKEEEKKQEDQPSEDRLQSSQGSDQKENNATIPEQKIVFTDQVKKNRVHNNKKSIYSSSVEKLIEDMKKIFWGIDMERIGVISQKADIEDFLDSLKEEFEKLKLFLTHVEICDAITHQFEVKHIERIEIDQVEKIIVNFISNQTVIPLYKI